MTDIELAVTFSLLWLWRETTTESVMRLHLLRETTIQPPAALDMHRISSAYLGSDDSDAGLTRARPRWRRHAVGNQLLRWSWSYVCYLTKSVRRRFSSIIERASVSRAELEFLQRTNLINTPDTNHWIPSSATSHPESTLTTSKYPPNP